MAIVVCEHLFLYDNMLNTQGGGGFPKTFLKVDILNKIEYYEYDLKMCQNIYKRLFAVQNLEFSL